MRLKGGLKTLILLGGLTLSSCTNATPDVTKIETETATLETIVETQTPTITPEPTEQPTITASPTPEEQVISLIFGGDVMEVRRRVDYNSPPLSESFSYISQFTKEADISFINLETPICDITGQRFNNDYATYSKHIFRSEPDSIYDIKEADIDIVSLANNHAMNQNYGCLEDTLELLDSVDIEYVGAGKDLKEARELKTVEIKDYTVGFLAYTDASNNIIPEIWIAGYKKTDSNGEENYTGVSPMNLDFLIKDIENAKDKVDFLIVSMHAGDEYKLQPNDWQKEFAITAIDYGADMVVGHHPHVIQPVTVYKEKYIFWSLGNLIFDTAQTRKEDVKQNLLIRVEILNDSVNNIEYIPLFSQEVQIPYKAPERISQNITDRLHTPVSLTR